MARAPCGWARSGQAGGATLDGRRFEHYQPLQVALPTLATGCIRLCAGAARLLCPPLAGSAALGVATSADARSPAPLVRGHTAPARMYSLRVLAMGGGALAARLMHCVGWALLDVGTDLVARFGQGGGTQTKHGDHMYTY